MQKNQIREAALALFGAAPIIVAIWYVYVTYQTGEGVRHDRPAHVHSAVTSPAESPTSTPEPSTATPLLAKTATPLLAKIVVRSPLKLSATTVAPGGTLSGSVTLQNQGSSSLTLRDIVIAGRPPGGSNSGGPFNDFGGADTVTLAPGQSITVQRSRTFTVADPTGRWYAFVTYQTGDGAWHDDPTDVHFIVR